MVTVQLHRTGVVLVLIGALLLGILIFVGGYLTGMRHERPALPTRAVAKPQVPALATAANVLPSAIAPKPEQLAIRAGLFTTSEEATAFAQQLTSRKLMATIATTPTSSGAMLYSVRIGQYTNRRDAAAAVEALKRDHDIDGAIVSIQPEPLQR
jgi:hypothetical protein